MAYSLITGASGGIGWALSKELASRKHDILLLARSGEQLRKNADQLQKDYGVRADYFEIDLSAPDAALKVLDWLQQKQYAIDILINNAGYAVWGKFQDLSRDELNRMMQLNMITMADMCKVLLPLLQQQKPAYLLNVSSTSGYQAVPTLSSYAASKAFVLLFTRGLHREMKGSNVSVSCLCPGTTTSGFMDRANMEPLKKTAEKFTMDATLVAKKAIDGLLAGKAEIIPGFMNWFSAKMAEIVPKAI
ncbi:MAG TPA: SDR family oxidoreductase, partial [Saprospiraceae bacterium]|nr:SDR family oxidoreductase [Saprospiraceae bacterium]